MFSPPMSSSGLSVQPLPWMVNMKRSSSLPVLLSSAAGGPQQAPLSPSKFLNASFSPAQSHAALFLPPSPASSRSNSLTNILATAAMNCFLPSSPLLHCQTNETEQFLRQLPPPSIVTSPLLRMGLGSHLPSEQPGLLRADSAGQLSRALSLLQMGISLDHSTETTNSIASQIATTTTTNDIFSDRIRAIVAMAWPTNDHLQRPPRDMKRFKKDEYYIVCEVLKRNDAPALLLRSFTNPEKDCGLYKPPLQVNDTHSFRIGDCLSLQEVGYSSSRNKIATQIAIRPSPLFFMEKPQWIPPPPLSTKSSSSSVTTFEELANLKVNKRIRSEGAGVVGIENLAGPIDTKPQQVSDLNIESAEDVLSETSDDQDLSDKVDTVLALSWTISLGKKPPCDMKRLSSSTYYVICKVCRWGESPALCLRSLEDPHKDVGFYKPPASYNNYLFRVGDCVQVTKVGYSPLRNKIASEIRVISTEFSGRPLSNAASVSTDGTAADFEPINDVEDKNERKLRQIREMNRLRQRMYRAEKRARLQSSSSIDY